MSNSLNLANNKSHTGAQELIEALLVNGVDTIFGIPGESFLAHLDAMREQKKALTFYVNRHEGGAAFMAEAYSKLTGKPGVLFVSRFPGATNASIGLGVAHEDSSPLVLFVGQVDQSVSGRESFQEIDYTGFFGGIAKRVFEINDVSRVGEIVTAAFQLAVSGRKGPVVVVLPHDIQLEAVAKHQLRSYKHIDNAPSQQDLTALTTMLRSSARPLLLLGGVGWSKLAQRQIVKFAEDNALPVVSASRRNDVFPNDHQNYAGVATVNMNPAVAELIVASDLIIALGCRLDEMTTGRYKLINAPIPLQKLVHIYPGSAELGNVYQADLLINADVCEMADSLYGFSKLYEQPLLEARRARVLAANLKYKEFVQYDGAHLKLNLAKVIEHMQEVLPQDTIVANGAGNNAQWLDRFYQYRFPCTKLTSFCGSMGYGVPAAIAAKLVYPERSVISWNGDGCFQMNFNELIVAAARRLQIVFLIIENGTYGTIRQHQEKNYPCHKFGTDIENPDFVQLAAAYNCFGVRVDSTEAFPEALAAARAYNGPSIIVLKVQPEMLSPNERISSTCDLELKSA